MENSKTFLCISNYFKGADFLIQLKNLGNKVYLVTSDKLKGEAWPHQHIDEIFYMEGQDIDWNLEHLLLGAGNLIVSTKIDSIVALDDFDVEKAAMIRETYRIPGMGQTTHRYFRDKLAMRQQAKDNSISVPEFSSIFNDAKLHQFTQDVPGPWVLKPRSEASASGIIKINSAEELWPAVENLGDERYKFLLEAFKPGDVYHVDCLIYNKEIVFSCFSKYLSPPMKVSHEGGVFRTKTLSKASEEAVGLEKINKEVLDKFGIQNGATHSEYIRGTDGQYYFLETSSRVGGAHIPDMIEAATGVNIWREWAKLENALLDGETYTVEETKKLFAGLIVSLAKEKHSDTTDLQNEDVEKFLPIDYHIGIVYKATTEKKIQERLDEAATIVTERILNILPPKDKPTS